jgi:hypothetical protein
MLNGISTPVRMALAMQGMGGIFDLSTGTQYGGTPGFNPSSGGGGGFDWGNLITQGFNFGNTFLTAKYAASAAKYGAGPYVQPAGQQQQLTAAQIAALQRDQGGGIGFGLDGQGLRLSDGSHIGWLPIVGVAGAFFLLQSQGIQRRGR